MRSAITAEPPPFDASRRAGVDSRARFFGSIGATDDPQATSNGPAESHIMNRGGHFHRGKP